MRDIRPFRNPEMRIQGVAHEAQKLVGGDCRIAPRSRVCQLLLALRDQKHRLSLAEGDADELPQARATAPLHWIRPAATFKWQV
jgi:hypothetical protein